MQVLWTLMTVHRILILKARQLGISWICCWYALWLLIFHPGRVVLIFSKGQAEANEMLQRIKKLYERLPDWMRAELPQLIKDNTEELEWDNGSRVMSLPATQNAGSGYTASLVILDEAAKIIWADQLFTALKPTIDNGGQLIILSSAFGIGNLFHRLWIKATSGLNTFTTIFLPWWARPTRDWAWYERQLGEYTDPQMVNQEYPQNANEAFLVSGRIRFATKWIVDQERNVREPLPDAQLPPALQGVQGLRVYALPEPGRRYILSADVAEGLEHGDFCAAHLVDAETWEEMAHLHGHWEPDEYGALLAQLGTVYDAVIAPERNNHGHAVLLKLNTLGYRRIYVAADGRYGWLTNDLTKTGMIDGLAVALRDKLVKIRTQSTLDECQYYTVLKNGKTGAPHGYFDDRVMSLAIAIAVAKEPQIATVGPSIYDL